MVSHGKTDKAEPSLEGFAEGDFHALSAACARDPQYDDRRLVLRRKLLAIGKAFIERSSAAGVDLEARGSLHQPNTFNAMQVRRMWVYACRGKAEKKRLKSTIGADLAKDLDAAYRNAYVCSAVESDAVECALRIHADAWYDAQNLANRVKAEGQDAWRALLNQLEGYHLRIADWKGEWSCGALTRDRLEEFLKYWKPGEHALVVERRWPASAGARVDVVSPEMPERLVGGMQRLLPLYRYSAWSGESDFLFRR